MSTDAAIIWLINGSQFNNMKHPGVMSVFLNESGTIVNTLTIPATLRYDRTEVVCVAFTSNGREESPLATLTVIAGMVSLIEWYNTCTCEGVHTMHTCTAIINLHALVITILLV